MDLARAMRPFAMLAHEVEQDADGAVHVRLRGLPDEPLDITGIRAALIELLGDAPGGVALDLREDPALGSRGDKPQPWRSAMRLDDLLRADRWPDDALAPPGPNQGVPQPKEPM